MNYYGLKKEVVFMLTYPFAIRPWSSGQFAG